MSIDVSTLVRVVGCALAVCAMPAAGVGTAGASVPVDLRVASNDGGNLADVRQYVPSSTTVKTFSGPDCFNSAHQSSGRSYPLSSPTMLGAIWEAAQVEGALQPVRISDADFASFGALGVCQVNAKTPPGFFFLKANHQALTVGADLFTLQGGEDLLVYRTPEDFTADEELDLSAPVRTAPGVPVTVNVRAYTTTVMPRSGATVAGGPAPVETDAAGNATLVFPAEGVYPLVAVGGYNDIPSPVRAVCVSARPEPACPDERGREILGSDEAEGIKGTDGNDVIRPRGGKDGVKAGAGSDLIIANGGGRDRVFCGGGKDRVKADRRDRVARNCEKVKRVGRHVKKKGKHRK